MGEFQHFCPRVQPLTINESRLVKQYYFVDLFSFPEDMKGFTSSGFTVNNLYVYVVPSWEPDPYLGLLCVQTQKKKLVPPLKSIQARTDVLLGQNFQVNNDSEYCNF